MNIYLKLFIGIVLLATLNLPAAESNNTIRIMPLGDSITYDERLSDVEDHPRPASQRSGYRNYLWYMLKDANMNVDFVGSQSAGQAITPPFDTDNEGHPGWTSSEINEKIYSYMLNSKPNMVLLHIGTNDHGTSVHSVDNILTEIDTYEQESNTSVRVLVALIIDRKDHDKTIQSFNENLKKLITSRYENGDNVTLVDMYNGAGLTSSDYADHTHPNDSGYKKMANVWFKAIQTPYVKYTSAPTAKADKISAETGSVVSYNILANDTDRQNDISKNTVSFLGGEDTDDDKDNNVLSVDGEGKWSVDEEGIVTFAPNESFTSDPTPVQYTVNDEENATSEPASITINYSNSSLDAYPSSIVPTPYIESVSIDEVSNSVTFITRIPENGILF